MTRNMISYGFIDRFHGSRCEYSDVIIDPPELCSTGNHSNPSEAGSCSSLTESACVEFYHGSRCDVYCRPNNTCAGGHYTCNLSTGAKVCLAGWRDPEGGCMARSIDGGQDCPEQPCREWRIVLRPPMLLRPRWVLNISAH